MSDFEDMFNEAQRKREQRALRANLRAIEQMRMSEQDRIDARAKKAGNLVEHKSVDELTGRVIRTWSGPKSAWMNHYKLPGFYGRIIAKGWDK